MMDLQSDSYPEFADICTKISLNLPEASTWRWDETFQTALVAFEKSDGDLVLFPLIKEFDRHWDFTSLQQGTGPFFEFFQSAFGVIPGQRIFTTDDSAGRTLFAVWWPWGDDVNISLRVGLFVAADQDTARERIKNLLSGWFHL
jgi:hypothetical protein